MTTLPNHRARRASVLVLVMTLLGILFVVGVAFLATMNFEADMISAEKQRSQSDGGVDAAVESVGSVIRNAVMASPGVPFGDSSQALSGSAFAEMPGVQNTFSPIEPIRRLRPGQTPFIDDTVVFNGYFDAQAHATGSSTTPSQIPGFYIDTNAFNAAAFKEAIFADAAGNSFTIPLGLCNDGAYKCDINTCIRDPQNPTDCIYPQVADADGDGIVDSLLVDAKKMGLSGAQLADLAARVNPASNLSGRVSLALRIVPHGGMVNLNESHPTLIQNVFDLQDWPTPLRPDSDLDTGFRHAPTQDLLTYSPAMEEPLLRRRNILPPRDFQPSLLHGNPLTNSTQSPSGGANMQKQLFGSAWPGGIAQDKYQSVFSLSHEFSTSVFAIDPQTGMKKAYPGNNEYYPYWDVMMDPHTAEVASPVPGTPSDYDRRHLVTTVSYDDLLARSGTVTTSRGKQDLRQALIEANWSNFDPDMCLPLMPFEYANYPATADEQRERANYSKTCCPDDPNCRPDALRGRLQLSLPWLDDQLAAANSTTLTTQQQNEYRQRIFHIIHDVFYMLVRNATQAIEVEGMACSMDQDCPISDTVCRLNGVVPPSGSTGYCVHRGNPLINTFAGCTVNSDCAFPGSACRSDGICTLTAPAWRDVECPTNACDSGEFCLINAGATVGVCADLWTRMRRSEALVARTAASLTANMIDFADQDSVPTPIAIRSFETTTKCNGGGNHYLPCASDTDCPGGTCMNLYGRDIDLDTTTAGVQGVYVYGLERHPFITEVATFADVPAPPGPNVVARAIELFNPYDAGITLDNEYFIAEISPTATNLIGVPLIALGGTLPPNIGAIANGPFGIFITAANTAQKTELQGTPAKGVDLNGNGNLQFMKGWTVYLLRSLDPANPNATKIVVDQFIVGGAVDHVGEEGPQLVPAACDPGAVPPIPCKFAAQRIVAPPQVASDPATAWTWSIPKFQGINNPNNVALGTWNSVADQTIHPVEVEFANTGRFGTHFGATVNASFPTTGSLSLLIRNADRAITDFAPPAIGGAATPVRNLAFNTALKGQTDATFRVESPAGSGSYQNIETLVEHSQQIDNGRVPLFDVGANNQPAEHLSPALFKPWDPINTNPNGSNKALPGDSNMLPWGQLLFDYFTALPISNGGPYDFDSAGNHLSVRDMPRVDESGLRVHGRININAAPWKVLAGLPLVPMTNPPGTDPTVTLAGLPLSYQNKIAPVSNVGRIGPELAQAIVAYRDSRAVVDGAGVLATGNYDDGSAAPGVTGAPSYGRGWTNSAPAARRGTGFMTVGELANVRHPGALGGPIYRIDAQKIDTDQNNNNTQDFVDAAAVLIALGDWVSVRSHVFTVYGQIRGADDPNVAALYTNPAQQAAALIQDTDARAIRFQETIDRLPVLQGQSRPRRIGERTVGRYTDVNND